MEKDLDQKNIPDHFEDPASEQHTNDVQLSGFEDLGTGATLKRFKYASFICILVTFSAAADGYQVRVVAKINPCEPLLTYSSQIGMNGNIIANTGTSTSDSNVRRSTLFLTMRSVPTRHHTGFIRQFATETDAEGNPVLAAGVLATWGPIMSVGQFVGMTTLPLSVAARVSWLLPGH